MNRKISVIVPIYNVAKFLDQAIISLLSQSYQNLDILLINDGSNDGSQDIIKKYAIIDKRIRVFNRQNEGLGKAINFGLNEAYGDYIAIFEPDDYLDPDIYLKMSVVAQQDSVDFVKCGYYKVFGEKVINSTIRFCEITNLSHNLQIKNHPRFLLDLAPSMWSLLISKDFLSKYKIRLNTTPGASFQDSAFNFLIFIYGNFSVIDESLYFYRQHESQSVRSSNKYKYLFNEYAFAKSHLKYNSERNCVSLHSDLLNVVYMKTLFNGFRQTNPSNRCSYYIELMEFIRDIKITDMLIFYSRTSNQLQLEALNYFKHNINNSYYWFLLKRKIMKYSLISLFSKNERNLYKSFCKKPSIFNYSK